MFAAHKIELRPTQAQADYMDQACGSRRHCYNQLLARFKEDGVKWSKKDAYAYYMETIRTQFDWYAEVSSRVTRNAIDDLDAAFKHFFRRVKLGQKPGFRMFRQMVEYKAKWRGVEFVLADRSFPSSKTCSDCGAVKSMPLNQRTYECSCGMLKDRDLNAAINLNNYGRDTLKRDLKRTQEKRQTCRNVSRFVNGVNLPTAKLA
jgi:transposase